MPKIDVRFRTDIETHRLRRTLSRVMQKLEEALALSRRLEQREDERATAAHHRR